MVVILAVAFMALLLGNGVLASSVEALRATYTRHVSGELSVAAGGESNFTIFGSDQLLVGEYLVPPTIVGFGELRDKAEGLPGVRATAGLVSAVASVRVGGRREERTIFGVDFDAYRRMFPDLELLAGGFPEPGERGIVLQAPWGEEQIGASALLSVARESSFTLRGLPVTGIFRYPVEEELLGRVALTDPDTARSLAGYIYGGAEEAEIPEEQQELLNSEMEDLFGGESGIAAGESGAGAVGSGPGDDDASGAADPEGLLESLGERGEAENARRAVTGAWNFLLISLEEGARPDRVFGALRNAGYSEEAGYLIREWRRTVGGTAQLVRYLQIMFNGGLLFVALGAAIIATNALVLSVLERTKEIGTFRALGATRERVALMIGAETVIVVVGSAALGLALGGAATAGLNEYAVVLENRYIRILFGGEPIRGTITGGLLLAHLGAALGLALLSLLYPLKRALSIPPVEAMSR